MTNTVDAAIELRGVNFAYRDAEDDTLKGIDLTVTPGEFVTVMGASGVGKSTMCQTLNGLIPKQIKGDIEGSVTVGGQDVSATRVAEMAETVGLVFQDFEAQLFSTNVELEIAFCVENLQVEKEEIRRRVAEALERVRLTGFENRQPATLSGGQKQRLAIASILAAQPAVMCLDEPTTDLDPVGKIEVFTIANELARTGMTLVIVEHETPEALMSTRLVLMEDGRIVRDGPSHEVLREVEVFEQLHIMPLQIPQLFAELGVATTERPLTVEEAQSEYDSGVRFSVNEAAYGELVRADAERQAGYGEVLISAVDVGHRYPTGLDAVKGVNLEIRKGEFVAVLGQNGSGKTTFVKHLNGLLRPTTGAINVVGKDTREQTLLELGNHVAYVFQNPDHQIFSDTVFDEVAFALRKRGMDAEEVETRVAEVIDAVGLSGQEEDDPFSLTKGQRQRVAVASALALHPEVLILDEPTTGLDYRQQKSMMELVKRLNEAGTTVVVVTHAMWVVCEYVHRVVVMKDGEVVANDVTRKVFSHEEELENMALAPPPVVALSNALGRTALSVAEMKAITSGAGR